MKKLIALAVTGIGIVCGVQAATVTWSVEGTLVDWNGASITGASGITAYVYALASAGDAITYANGAFSFGTAQLVESSSAFDDGWANWDGKDSSVSNLGNDPQFFQVILSDAANLSSLSDGDHIFLYAANGDATVQYSANPATPTLIDGYTFFESTGTTAGGWSTASVPEPTSGILLLLGMAGLALKRKHV